MKKMSQSGSDSEVPPAAPAPATKRVMTPERLEQLAKAREKALANRAKAAQITKTKKEIREKSLDVRLRRVQAIKQEVDKAHEAAVNPPEPPPAPPAPAPAPAPAQPAKRSKKKKRRIYDSSSEDSSSEDSSDDDIRVLKARLKSKYKKRYASAVTPPPPQDLVRQSATEMLRSKCDKELQRLAISSIFPDW